jgi:hypothetical protein
MMMIVTAKLGQACNWPVWPRYAKFLDKQFIGSCQQAFAAIPYPHSALTGCLTLNFAKLIVE